jgi:hypothetical protein
MVRIKTVGIALALFLVIGFCTQNSFAIEYVYFCVGSEQKCYKVLKSDVERFPHSMLAVMISDRVPSERKMIPEEVFNEETGEVEKRAIPYYVLNGVDGQAFRAILRWMGTETRSVSLITEANQATVVEDARYLILPELVEALIGKETVCPEGYVLVPGSPHYRTLGVGEDFCVMKYAATKDETGLVAQSRVGGGAPWVRVNRAAASAACSANGPGYHLMTNEQWMAIARNIEATPANWSRGRVGAGILSRGNSDSAAASTPCTDDNPYFGTGFAGDWIHKRTHVLSNGGVIWDMAGNVWEWVSDKLTTACLGWQGYKSVHFAPASTEGLRFLYGPAGAYDAAENMGIVYMGNAKAVLRGGDWQSVRAAGVFAAHLGNAAVGEYTYVGFRCTYLPEGVRR